MCEAKSKSLQHHLEWEQRRPRARRLLNDSAAAISGYIRGNLAISVIAGISALAGMLVLGIPYALPLSAVLAVIDLIPMVGVTLGPFPLFSQP